MEALAPLKDKGGVYVCVSDSVLSQEISRLASLTPSAESIIKIESFAINR